MSILFAVAGWIVLAGGMLTILVSIGGSELAGASAGLGAVLVSLFLFGFGAIIKRLEQKREFSSLNQLPHCLSFVRADR